MQKFVLKVVIFLLGILFLVQVLAYFTENFVPDNNAGILLGDRQSLENLLEQAPQVEALAIGNSHSQVIDFEALSYNGYKLPRSGRDFFEIRYYLEGLIPKLPKVNTVLIPVSYFSFLRDNAVVEEVRIRRIHTYIVVPSWRYIDNDFENFAIGKSHPLFPLTSVARDDSWQGVFNIRFFNNSNSLESVDITGETEHPCQGRELQYLNAHARLRADQHIKYATQMKANHPDLEQDTYKTLTKIIEYLQARDIRVIFFTPPYFEAYTSAYQASDPEAIIMMQKNMQRLQQKYGVEYYNFATDKAFVSDPNNFTDSDHLSSCMAKQFSAELKRLMVANE